MSWEILDGLHHRITDKELEAYNKICDMEKEVGGDLSSFKKQWSLEVYDRILDEMANTLLDLYEEEKNNKKTL